MNRKILFFDIDGTLVDFNRKMPDSAKEALKKARENGHLLVICSGRSACQIYPWLVDLGFDAMICAAGSHVMLNKDLMLQIDGRDAPSENPLGCSHSPSRESEVKVLKRFDHYRTIAHFTFGTDRVQAVIDLLKEIGASFFIQDSYGCYMEASSMAALRVKLGQTFSEPSTASDDKASFLEIMKKTIGGMEIVPSLTDSISRFADVETSLYTGASMQVSAMDELLAPFALKALPSSIIDPEGTSGEITLRDINKASGMRRLLDFLLMEQSDTIAFGDGPNDLDMLRFARVGVVMGNGTDQAKKAADMITDDIDQDGLWNAMKKLELI